ncbi:hypothetical protein ACH4NT_12590 [Streptomyces lydicus]|uniref:hypothetical protein n=1 Tax=Streptomyces lydicus TaxID=47763 RepID=UPI0037A1CF3C
MLYALAVGPAAQFFLPWFAYRGTAGREDAAGAGGGTGPGAGPRRTPVLSPAPPAPGP